MKKIFVVLTTFLATLMLVACQNNASTSDNTELSSMPKITGFSYPVSYTHLTLPTT